MNEKGEELIAQINIDTSELAKKLGVVKDRFIKVIEDNVPTDDKIVYMSDEIRIDTSQDLQRGFKEVSITISWKEG